MSAATFATAISIGLTFALFICGAFTMFRRVEEDDIRFIGIKLLTVVTVGYTLWCLFQRGARVPTLAIAASVAAALLFLWTARHVSKRLTLAYSSDQPALIYSNGPFQLIRHPFYASYLLGYGAAIAACGTWLSLVLGSIAVAVYLHAARFEEEKFSRSGLAGEYEKYKAATGMFIPRIRGRRDAP